MLIQHSRRDARVRNGCLVLLDDQDRCLWDAAMLEEGRSFLATAISLQGDGPYLIQSAIADLHLQTTATGNRSHSSTPPLSAQPGRRSSP